MTAAAVTRVRRARVADLSEVALLAAEHAAYEGAPPPPAGLASRLARLLFDTENPRPRCFVAGLGQVQWQTPPWTTDAIRFYDRLGAQAKEKRRYSLPVG
ncbi:MULTISPECIES: hypothetical protein [unclassified Streptomyces]|uniref:hypothetical protein n=1 Tax=unclassified Streptomyces TaxID=2593676 RepID=UPI0038235875